MLDTLRAYSLGYQGMTLARYIKILSAHDVSTVIDVRETAWSYKPGFSKKALAEELHANGIGYLHLKSAGNPSKNRKSGLPQLEVIELYKQHLDHNPVCLDEILAFILASPEEGPICLLCFEEEPHDCHRKVILDRLAERTGRISILHLSARSIVSEEERVDKGVPKSNNRKRARKHVEISEDQASLVLA